MNRGYPSRSKPGCVADLFLGLDSQEGLTPESVGQVRAFSPQAIATFKSLSIPPMIQKEVSQSAPRVDLVAALG